MASIVNKAATKKHNWPTSGKHVDQKANRDCLRLIAAVIHFTPETDPIPNRNPSPDPDMETPQWETPELLPELEEMEGPSDNELKNLAKQGY